MRGASWEIDPVSGLEADRLRRDVGECDIEYSLEDPQALVLFVPVARINDSGNVVPTKAFVAFLVKARFCLNFRESLVLLGAKDPNPVGEVIDSRARPFGFL
jgi:hypothetical protein